MNILSGTKGPWSPSEELPETPARGPFVAAAWTVILLLGALVWALAGIGAASLIGRLT